MQSVLVRLPGHRERQTDGGWQDWSGGLLIIKSREEHMVVDLSLITNRDQTDQEEQT